MRILVTGATGFVGRHLVHLLLARRHEVYGTYLERESSQPPDRIRLFRCDVRQAGRLRSIVRRIRPQRIYHLAALSSVAESFKNVRAVYDTNFWGTFNLLEAVREAAPKARVLVVSSAQCYAAAKRSQLPVTESHPFAPPSPYALSKAAADMLAHQYHSLFGLHVIRARPYNHTGPGQTPHFVCSDFARQIAAIDLGLRPALLRVGNLKVRRDFSDVRDVVRAYALLLEKGKPGEAYNVASGRGTSLEEIVRLLASFCSRPIRVVVERKRFRPGDVPVLYSSNRKLRRTTGWRPERNLRATLRDLFFYWKNNLQTRKGRD
jgi:GDP-4-dehydro-6-deoxy-D-mannose reductase